MRRAASILAALLAAATCAAAVNPWQNLGEGWYAPKKINVSDRYSWQVADTSGETHIIDFTYSDEGFINNADEVIKTMKSSVASLFRNVAGLSNQIANNARALELADQKFEALAERLDSAFTEVFGSLQELEIKKDEGSAGKTLRVSSIEKGRLTLVGNVGNFDPDGKSIETASDGKARVKGFSGSIDGSIPVSLQGEEIAWHSLISAGDGKSIVFNHDEDKPFAGTLSLAGWEDHGTLNGVEGYCADSLWDLLTGVKSEGSHRVLTWFDGGKLHYTKIGAPTGETGKFLQAKEGGVEWSAAVSEVKAEEGSAVKAETDAETGGVTLSFENPGVEVAGTQGASQSGAKLKFEGNANTAVRTTVVKDGDTVKVQIGVYYR